MKPPERFPSDDPREWLNRAKSNLALAENHIPGAYLEDLCFEAQQAAEKAVKALMIGRSIEYPYIHDLARLLSLLEKTGEIVPDTVRKAGELTVYAAVTRYPGAVEPITVQQYKQAVEIAQTVVQWVEERLEFP